MGKERDIDQYDVGDGPWVVPPSENGGIGMPITRPGGEPEEVPISI